MADERVLDYTALRLRREPDIDPSIRQMQLISSCLILLAVSVTCPAQTLHVPSRSIYKCDSNGAMTYSDAPCLGASRLEIEPTRGVGKTAGYDVQREQQREMIAESIRPLTGLDANRDFNLKNYGYRKLVDLVEAIGLFKIVRAEKAVLVQDERTWADALWQHVHAGIVHESTA